MRVITAVCIGYVAAIWWGPRDPYHLVVDAVLAVAAGLVWVWFQHGRREEEPDPDLDDTTLQRRGRIISVLAGFFMAAWLVAASALLQRTFVYSWFVDRPGLALVEQADELLGAQAWAAAVALLTKPLPGGITAETTHRLRELHYQALIHLAAGQQDLSDRCVSLASAETLARANTIDPAAAANAATACAMLLETRAPVPGSKIDVLASGREGSIPVVRVRVSDAAGNSLAGLGPADFAVTAAGRRVAVTGVRFETPPQATDSLAVILDNTEALSRGWHTVQLLLAFLSGSLRERDAVELLTDADSVESRPGTGSIGLMVATGSVRIGGRPRRWDAVFQAIQHLRDMPARRSILLIATGGDAGSSHKEEELLPALQESHISLFVLAAVAGTEPDLRRTAELSGGDYIEGLGNGFGEVRTRLVRQIRAEPFYVLRLASPARGGIAVAFASPPERQEAPQ